ncbi:MerR family transcriptional regulator [Clostridium botulinum]|nr:MerR family transcriptional regulator [Clostridium botulinum]NFI17788.1 MerR family transcriptional regulator [Clostridium botulinum]NFI54415.1 MerR family transcriptional regulator [Clostridium botulinum]NFL94000.1 MerR family transcriptional regulator [Clostridium botulinum]NFN53399.1 MerR family transcriptional regulator [Clostridium botulinum]
MNERLYKIQEVAKLHNITKKTLLYYEKIGLFIPYEIDKQNNYRYYRRIDFPILKQVIYLKDIGFTLQEIKEILDSQSHEFMINCLKRKQEEVEKKIEELKNINDGINAQININKIALEIKEKDLKRPSLKIYNERKIISMEGVEQSKEAVMLAYRKLLNYLMNSNMFSHEAYGGMYHLDKKLKVGAFIEIPNQFNIQNTDIIPSGKYICMYHKGSYYNKESVEYLLNWIEKNNYRALGNIYDYCIVDRCFAKDENNMILEIQIKIE